MLPGLTGYRVRPATSEEARVVAQLIIECDIAESGSADYSLEQLEQRWSSAGFVLQTDSALIFTQDEQLVGYVGIGGLNQPQIQIDGYVHPQWNGRGIGSYLLKWAENRATEYLRTNPPAQPVYINNWTNAANVAARQLFEQYGYQPIRHIWRMSIILNEAPSEANLPAGIQIRNYRPAQDEFVTYEAYEDAFKDHWDHVRRSFEVWQKRHLRIDSSLWFLAWEGEQVAGIALCSDYSGSAVVNLLGVRAGWRGKGLGMALLNHSFRQFYLRGRREVRLGVDSQSLTGATRLYLRAGMKIDRQYDRYQKEFLVGPVAKN